MAVWAWFLTVVVTPPCLDTPTLRVADLPAGIAGTYSPWTRTVTVEPGAPRWVAVHEMAHHYFYACRIQGRPVGRQWERLTGISLLSRRGVEDWATTFTFLLTGSRQGGAFEIHREASAAYSRLFRVGFGTDSGTG